MYKLSVVIPCYNAKETIAKSLHSIAMQSISDEIEVIIVNDCDGINYDAIIDTARFGDLHIKYIVRDKNGGCGASRNTGISQATSDYVMFLDADDCFTNCLALEILYNRIKSEDADMLVSGFESEIRQPNGIAIKKINKSPTWCHGRVYKRQYLLDNNLYFDERLRINEDVEFHQLLIDLGAKIIEEPITTLMWRDNPKSVTHQSLYENKRTYILAVMNYLEECFARNMSGDKITFRVLQNLVVIYQYFNIVLDDCPENKNDYLQVCRQYWKYCEPFVQDVSDDLITTIYCHIMKDFSCVPNVSFVDFLNLIRN